MSGVAERQEGIKDASAAKPNAGNTIMLRNGRTMQIGTKEMALDNTESGFGAWDLSGRLLYFGHLFWLAKEIFWLLLISYAAFACGAIALVLVAISMIRRLDGGISGKLYSERWAELLISIIHFCWLFWNIVGMLLNLVYQRPDNVPGYAEEMVDLSGCDESGSEGCINASEKILTAVRVGFGVTTVLWIGSCIYMLYLWLKPPRYVMQGYSLQVVFLEGGWISFWVLKDLAWTWEKEGFACAVIAWCIHFVLLVVALVTASTKVVLWDGISHEEMERLGNLATTVDLVILSYISWSISSLLWLLMEVPYDEPLALRFVAAGVCGLSMLLFACGYTQARQKAKAVQIISQEDQYPVLPRRMSPDAEVVGAGST